MTNSMSFKSKAKKSLQTTTKLRRKRLENKQKYETFFYRFSHEKKLDSQVLYVKIVYIKRFTRYSTYVLTYNTIYFHTVCKHFPEYHSDFCLEKQT